MKPVVRRFASVAAAGVVAALAWQLYGGSGESQGPAPRDAAVQQNARTIARAGADEAREAFEQQARSRQLLVRGRVQRTLSDDRDGSPHQRFILVTNSGQSLLVAHNIDLAPRLEGLSAGDEVSVYGEYEWNPQGGLMHWTHDDPQGSHVTGYIEWRGRRYQ